ncbi:MULTISPECIES: GNAT family N-acetyltransferase [unclassified Aeromicrobium]|uniref:GNAT family N-acetyltransferase n=1 Tax=unclassified Aeromicrobium TaxID=2633570 RepID=UPI00288A74B8|nr:MULTISPECIES: GNAT family N-acetyltransferase [unclassified Aeromicrobium]
MRWRVRATFPDRPGLLGRIALACGEADVNIVGMQVFSTRPTVTDEFVVEAGDDWTDVGLSELFVGAGGTAVAVTRADEDAVLDTPTRYLDAVHQVLEEGRDVEDVLAELLATEPPDVADYAGHDVLDLRRRNGTALRISRAVPFTAVERARAQALLSLVSDAGVDVPLIAPSPRHPMPLVRLAGLADIEAVAALHERCSVDTLYTRYQVPLRMPMTTRMARRLVTPEHGLAIVVQVGLDLVGHGVLEPLEDRLVFQLLVEDAWQGRGFGTLLVKHAARHAKAQGAEHLTFVSAGSNDMLLRAVGAAGFVARVERHDAAVHITVPLAGVRAAESA